MLCQQLPRTISLRGNDENGCESTVKYLLTVDNCTSLNKLSPSSLVTIFPNPGTGIYTIESAGKENTVIVVTDLAGGIIFTEATGNAKILLDLRNVTNGIY